MGAHTLEKPRTRARAEAGAEERAGASAAKRTRIASARAGASSLTAQMNVRMDVALHEAGNTALAEIGVSPSQAVRALWEKAAKRGKDLEEVRTFLFTPATAQGAEVERQLALAEAGRRIADDFYRSRGVDPGNLPADTRTDEELREEMYAEAARAMGA